MKRNDHRPDLVIPGATKGLVTILEFKAMDIDGFIKRQPPEHREALKKISEVLHKYKGPIEEISEALLDYQRLIVIENPTVYIARTTDIKTGIEYFTAKTYWPMSDFKKKVVKIYLGKATLFDNDTKSPKAKNEAIVKMRQTLARRMRAGEI